MRRVITMKMKQQEQNDNRNWLVKVMDGIAGIDNTGAEINNTVSDIRRQTKIRRKTKRVR